MAQALQRQWAARLAHAQLHRHQTHVHARATSQKESARHSKSLNCCIRPKQARALGRTRLRRLHPALRDQHAAQQCIQRVCTLMAQQSFLLLVLLPVLRPLPAAATDARANSELASNSTNTEHVLAQLLSERVVSMREDERVAFFEQLLRAASADDAASMNARSPSPSSSSSSQRFTGSWRSNLLSKLLDAPSLRYQPFSPEAAPADSSPSLQSFSSSDSDEPSAASPSAETSEPGSSASSETSSAATNTTETPAQATPDDEAQSVLQRFVSSIVSVLTDPNPLARLQQFASTRNGRLSLGVGLFALAGSSTLLSTLRTVRQPQQREGEQFVRPSIQATDDVTASPSSPLQQPQELVDASDMRRRQAQGSNVLWRRANDDASDEVQSGNSPPSTTGDRAADVNQVDAFSYEDDEFDDLPMKTTADIEQNFEDIRSSAS